MRNDKRGLSTVVVTLIIVALSLAAVGAVYYVVNNVIQGQSSTVNWNSACLSLDIRPTSAVCSGTPANDCVVTLTRMSGTEVITGVNLVFTATDGVTKGTAVDSVGDVVSSRNTATLTDVTTTKPSKVEAQIYFTDSEGRHNCPNIASFNIP